MNDYNLLVRTSIQVSISVLLILLPTAVMGDDTVDFQFDDHIWKHRIIVLYSAGEQSDTYLQQRNSFGGRGPGFVDRDLLLVSSFSETEARFRRNPDSTYFNITSASAQKIYSRFADRKDRFSIYLIGKDGTKKLSSHHPLSVETIFETIDAMPMRRREVKQNN